MQECFVHQIDDFQFLNYFLATCESLVLHVAVGHLDLEPSLEL